MYFNPYVGRSPNLSFFGIGPWAIIHGIGPKLAYSPLYTLCIELEFILHREELQDKYDGKLSKQLTGTFYEVFSRVLRNLVGKKITVPGTFKR